MIITGGFNYTFTLFKKKKPFNFDLYFGSQWWTLTSECAFSLLDYCENHKEYIDYFYNTIIPDECFFQTIYMNSNFSKMRKNNLVYVNWGKNRRSPETITISCLKKLQTISKEKCLARKFDENIDLEIIKKL